MMINWQNRLNNSSLPVPEPFPEPDSNRSNDHRHKAGRTGGSSDDG